MCAQIAAPVVSGCVTETAASPASPPSDEPQAATTTASPMATATDLEKDLNIGPPYGEEAVEYPHDCLKPILEETYGVIVYQVQVMRIANVLASFSMNQADALRKAMGKKKPEVMAKFKEEFIEGSVEQGHPRRFAKELFETMELRLLAAMRDDPAAVPSLQLNCNLLWSLLNPEHFTE